MDEPKAAPVTWRARCWWQGCHNHPGTSLAEASCVQGLPLVGFQPCRVVLPQPKPLWAGLLLPGAGAERGVSGRSVLAVTARPRGHCPELSVTSGTPSAPFPCSQHGQRGSWLHSAPACPFSALQSHQKGLKGGGNIPAMPVQC